MFRAIWETFAIALAKARGNEDEVLDRLTDDTPLGRMPRPGELLGPY